jgi:hypothetical protein
MKAWRRVAEPHRWVASAHSGIPFDAIIDLACLNPALMFHPDTRLSDALRAQILPCSRVSCCPSWECHVVVRCGEQRRHKEP